MFERPGTLISVQPGFPDPTEGNKSRWEKEFGMIREPPLNPWGSPFYSAPGRGQIQRPYYPGHDRSLPNKYLERRHASLSRSFEKIHPREHSTAPAKECFTYRCISSVIFFVLSLTPSSCPSFFRFLADVRATGASVSGHSILVSFSLSSYPHLFAHVSYLLCK